MLNLQQTTHDLRLKILFIFIVSSLLWVVSQTAHAASYSVEISTGGEVINAIEGTVVLSEDVGEAGIGNSAILIWINNPSIEGRAVSFAGITPGGFSGTHPLFSVESASGLRIISSEVTALRSDGSGNQVPVKLSLVASQPDEDASPPEPFQPVIASSPDAYEGRHFVSFVAQDKASGVERYEAATTWLFPPREKGWREVESPLVLTRLENFKRIHIRATDSSGNWREVSTRGPYYLVTLFVLGTIIVLCGLWLIRRFSR